LGQKLKLTWAVMTLHDLQSPSDARFPILRTYKTRQTMLLFLSWRTPALIQRLIQRFECQAPLCLSFNIMLHVSQSIKYTLGGVMSGSRWLVSIHSLACSSHLPLTLYRLPHSWSASIR